MVNKKFNEVYWLNENKEKPIELSIYNEYVRKAFIDFSRIVSSDNFVLIGGLAMGAYSISRDTTDIDIAVLTNNDIDILANQLKPLFKRNRNSAIEHIKTGVEIEVVTPKHINQNPIIVKNAIETAREDIVNGNKIKIATPKYLIALKLGRASDETNIKSQIDKFDILNLLKIYGVQNLSNEPLNQKEIKTYKDLIEQYKKLKT